jgi:alpha-tubulin suppressor-like RCC1 family protein
MRWVLAVGLVAACGRIGFDDDEVVHRWARVATSGQSTCAITATGELWCWGAGAYAVLGNGAVVAQQLMRVGTQTDWTDVSVGIVLTCALRADRSLWCWGFNESGAIPGAPIDTVVAAPLQIGTGTWQAVAVADSHACAIDDAGGLACWGGGSLGVLGNGSTTMTVATPTPVVSVGTDRWTAISTSPRTTCGIQTDDSLWCWGSNNLGQVGDGTQLQRNAPVQIGSGRTWTAVSTSAEHTCAVEQGGQAWCWGNNFFGQVGNDVAFSTVPILSPLRATVASPVVDVAVGRWHTCGRSAAGDVTCWGNAERGQFGVVLGYSTQPIAIASSAVQVATAGDVTCVIDGDQRLACTGANNFGQAGGAAGIALVPTQVDTRTDWARVIAMSNHACALTTVGGLHCWGLNHNGELANGMPQDTDVPIDTNRTFSSIALGTFGLAAIAADNSLWFSGLHPDLATKVLVPTQFAGANTTKAVAAGELHACRILVDDTLVCGGANNHGQLGDGTTTSKVGTTVPGTWRLIAAGANSTCGVTLASQLMCWGRNEAGQLGIGSTSQAATPQPVMLPGAAGAVLELAVGDNFTCAITGAGELYCWGAGDAGQLANGTSSGSLTPRRVGTATDWRHVTAGDAHACAIKQDNTLWCWGHGDEGQTGPVLANHTSPVQVGGADWLDVSAGTHFTCAVKLAGTRWCFGSNNNGELGNDGGWRDQFAVIP